MHISHQNTFAYCGNLWLRPPKGKLDYINMKHTKKIPIYIRSVSVCRCPTVHTQVVSSFVRMRFVDMIPEDLSSNLTYDSIIWV